MIEPARLLVFIRGLIELEDPSPAAARGGRRLGCAGVIGISGKICRAGAILSLVLLALSAQGHAAPALIVQSYSADTSFSDQPVVLIQQGDDLAYREPEYDDAAWAVTSLPSAWTDQFPNYNGICWYRIHLRLPETRPTAALGVSLGVITDADETYFNGRLIGSSGRVYEPHEAAYDKRRVYEIPTDLIDPDGPNVLAIRVRGLFPYANGPFTGAFLIGPFGDLQRSLFGGEFLSLFLVVVYLVVAAYFFLFFARRPVARENFFFALFALAMGLYFALRTQAKHFIGADFYLTKKLEYLVLSALVPLVVEFLLVYFRKRHTVLHWIYFGLSGLHFSFFLVTGSYRLWDTYNQYVQIPTWAFRIVLSFIVLLGSIRKDRDARLMLSALIVLLLTMINDILVNMVAYDFIRLHGVVEDLNRNLERRVAERTEELNKTIVDLEAAKAETDNLLENVREGIFLLDSELVIGDHHSRMLETIFEKEEMGGLRFVDHLVEITDAKTAAQAKEFHEIALARKLPQKRLQSLNPISEAQVVLQKDGQVKPKTLRFDFARIQGKDATPYLLGTVQDATEEKLLAERIRESERRSQDEMKLLLGILHLNPEVVRIFVEETGTEVASVEKNLESAGFGADLRALLDSVYRSVHSIKGNASVLGLDMFSRQAHQFEESIRGLFEKEDLAALDLLALLYSIVGLKEALAQVQDLLERMAGFRKEFGSQAEAGELDERKLLMQTAKDLAERVAGRESKDVAVAFDDFEVPVDRGLDARSVKKVLIQFVKNAVTHGIEPPAERAAAGKRPQGTVKVSAKAEGDEFVMSVEDDGRGLQLEALRARALERGLHTAAEMASWTTARTAQLVFAPGLSTQTEATLDAGRGVGLDVVRQEVRQAGGKIAFAFQPGKYTRFTVRFPLRA